MLAIELPRIVSEQVLCKTEQHNQRSVDFKIRHSAEFPNKIVFSL